MRSSWIVAVPIAVAVVAGIAAMTTRTLSRAVPPFPAVPERVRFVDPYDAPQQFMEGIYAADRAAWAPMSDGVVRAIVVPHHLTASASIAAGVKALVGGPVKRVLLLAPDHFDRCPTMLCTVNGVQETIFGDAAADPSAVRALLASPLVVARAELFRQEHGIHAVTPFIAHYLPGVPVTPLVLSQRLPWKGDREAILRIVGSVMDEGTVLVVSSDFSHYLPLEAAEKMDELTAAALLDGDLDALADLKNPEQSDCPGCVWTLASFAAARDAVPEIILHTNSATILSDPAVVETTSHFSIVWQEKRR